MKVLAKMADTSAQYSDRLRGYCTQRHLKIEVHIQGSRCVAVLHFLEVGELRKPLILIQLS